jgi:Rrf2 family transcriptional regulator, cysteine metabolism repressor
MTLLSRKADYALLILSYLHDRPGTARAVAEKFGLSRPFVANILKELCQQGFVASHRGVKGGYALARPANTITLAELMETLEDGVRLAVCNPGTQDHDACSIAGACTLKGPITQVHNKLVEVLRGVTLAELFDARVEPTQPATLLGLSLLDSSGSAAVKSSPA